MFITPGQGLRVAADDRSTLRPRHDDAYSAFIPFSHHSRAESRQLSVGSGASGSVPKGNRTVVQPARLPAIPLVLVA